VVADDWFKSCLLPIFLWQSKVHPFVSPPQRQLLPTLLVFLSRLQNRVDIYGSLSVVLSLHPPRVGRVVFNSHLLLSHLRACQWPIFTFDGIYGVTTCYTSVHIWYQTDFQTLPLSEISNFAWFSHRQALKRQQPNLHNRLATGHIADTRTLREPNGASQFGTCNKVVMSHREPVSNGVYSAFRLTVNIEIWLLIG